MRVGIFGSKYQVEKQSQIKRLFEKLISQEADVYKRQGYASDAGRTLVDTVPFRRLFCPLLCDLAATLPF